MIGRRGARPGVGPGWRAAALAGCALLAACAGRQAVVESDPRGGAEARRQLEAAARSDLDALRRAQSDHFTQNGTYAYDLARLGVEPSPGIEISVLEATPSGFSAIARAGSVECGLYVEGADPPRSYTTVAGVVACRS